MGPDSGPKVRIVARIRGFSTREVEAQSRVLSWVSVSRANENSSSGVTVSFQSDQTSSARQSYEVDECFELDAGTDVIFSGEIKPLISGVFEGRHATVFAYGARGSGKTFTVQGSEDQQGLAALAMSSILSYAEVVGKSVTISLYEVYQDHVFDLLNSSRPEVSIFEDGHGRITLKGLSKVKVTTMAEFQNLHIRGVTVPKQSRWSHKGLIVHVVSSPTENSNGLLVGKLNFVDLAGYEDPRRKNNEESKLVEISRTNKTMYAVHNVLRALNAGETRVPYRESRLTRILQDSLGGLHKILMIACINPSICLETVQAVSLACRSCKASNGSLPVLSKSSKSATKPIAMSSSKIMRSTVAARTNLVCSPRVTKSISTSASAQKPARSELQSSLKKAKGATFSGKRRILFNEANQWKSSEQGSICSESASATGTSQEEEGNSHLQHTSASESSPKDKEKYALDVFSEAQSSQIAPVEEEKYAVDAFSEAQSSQIAPVEEEEVAKAVHNHETSTPAAYHTPATVSFSFEEKENNSPPLSTRLRELSNNLKSLCHSSGSTLKMSNYEHMEPKTPVGRADTNKIEFLGIKSPWEKFHTRSSGMKDSFVQEYLKFLNSASKDELKGLKGIGEKRASYILELREESPEPFKDLDDLKDIGLSAKQIKGMMKKAAGDLFN